MPHIGDTILGDFYLSTGVLEGLLQCFSFFLANAFLQFAGSAVNEVLSFLQAKTAGFLHSLNNLQFSSTSALEHYVERRLLLSGSSGGCSRTGSNCNSCSGGFNTILVLQDRCQFVNFLYCQIYQFFSNSFDICHFLLII